MQDAIKQRIREALDYFGSNVNCISSNSAEQKRLNNQINGSTQLSADTISLILSAFDYLSPEWLMTGRGSIETKSQVVASYATNGTGVPFYNTLPVSAGVLDMIQTKEDRAGFIEIPGIKAVAAFPVVGYSMEPVIRPGDIIAVDVVERWDRLDPDKIYMVVTDSERMIKHLRIDSNDNSFIWAISTNYKEFKIYVNEIKAIYQVVFNGRLV